MDERATAPAERPTPSAGSPDSLRLAPDEDAAATGSSDGAPALPPGRAWVTPALTGLLVVCFVGSIARGVHPISPTAAQLLAVGASFGPGLIDGEWWRLLTAELLHAGIVHLAFNLGALWGAGQFAERIYGNAAFLAIYLLSALGATLLSVAVAPLTVSVGASGAIFGVYGAHLAAAWLRHVPFPRAVVQRQRAALLLFLAYNAALAIANRRIDAAGHAGGFAVGVALGVLLRRDLRDPRSGGLRRVGAVVAVAALLVAAAAGVRARVAAVPEVRSVLLSHEAAAALDAGQLDAAVEKAGAAIAVHEAWRPRRVRALALDRLGRKREALDDAKVAAALAPEDTSRALELKGSLEFSLGLTDDALHTCDLISNRAPWRASGFRAGSVAFCVEVYLAGGHSKVALGWADRLIGADRESAAGFKGRAFVLMHEGELDRARADLDAAIEKEPDGTWALNARAWLRVADQDFEGARKDADRSIAVDGSSAGALGTRCFARAGLGDEEGAFPDCARAVERALPGAPEYLGMVAFLSGNRASALRLWREAALRNPVSARVLAPWIAKAGGDLVRR